MDSIVAKAETSKVTVDFETWIARLQKVKAYSITEGHSSWLIECPNCGRVHRHGAGEGTRTPHCHASGQKPYNLIFAGPASEEMIIGFYAPPSPYRPKNWRRRMERAIAWEVQAAETRRRMEARSARIKARQEVGNG